MNLPETTAEQTSNWTLPDLQQQISCLKSKIEFLENISKTPPNVLLAGFQEVNSSLTHHWKDHVYDILLRNNISPVWILDIINLEPTEPVCNKVLIQFVSHYVKTKVFIRLHNFIKTNHYNQLSIDEYVE